MRALLLLLTLANLNLGFASAALSEENCRNHESALCQDEASSGADCHETPTASCECNDCLKCSASLTVIPAPKSFVSLIEIPSDEIFHATDSFFTLYPLALIRPPSRA